MQAEPPRRQAAGEARCPTVDAMCQRTQNLKRTLDPSWFDVRVACGTCGVIEVSGELDLAGAPVLEAAVRDLNLLTARAAVLDLRQLTFIDAAGLNAVVDLYAECQNRAVTLTIIPGPRSVQRLFELTRLDRLLPFSDPLTKRRDHACQ
jgi:anti-sigma B factor antagonist